MTRKHSLTQFLVNVILVLLVTCANAAPTPIAAPTPPTINSSAHILIDFHSGQVLSEHDSFKKVEPASLTKMMTMYVIDTELQNNKLKLEDEIFISEKSWRTAGSKMFVEVNQKITVDNLVKGIVIQSGNDACIAMAEHIAGSEETFTELMNQHAKRLGMHNTHFANVTGLPNTENYTTAADLSILARAVIRDFPHTYHLYSQKWFTYNGIKQPNRNKLLWKDPNVDGIKTGNTDRAGYCLAASALKNNMRLIAIVMGTSGEDMRAIEAQKLLSYGFRFFETRKLFDANKALAEPKVQVGKSSSVPLGLIEDLYVTIPQGQYSHVNAALEVNAEIKAPVKKGQSFGKVVVKVGDKLLTEVDLVALNEVEKGGMFSRIGSYVSSGVSKITGK